MIGFHPLYLCLVLIQRVSQLLIFSFDIFRVLFYLFLLLQKHVLLISEQLILGLQLNRPLDHVNFVIFPRFHHHELLLFLNNYLLLGVEFSVSILLLIFDSLYLNVLLCDMSSMRFLLLHQLLLEISFIASQVL